MLFRGAKTMLGVMLTPTRIRVAEVRRGRRGSQWLRCADLPLSPELDWERPAELGAALGAFLRREKFIATRAVVGLPESWLLTQPKKLPPMQASMVAGALRLMAEQDLAAQGFEWVMDYCGILHEGAPSSLLLVAAPSNRLEQITQMIQTAGLRPVCVTANMLALAPLAALPDRMAETNHQPLRIHLLTTDTGLDVLLSCADRIMMTGKLNSTAMDVAKNPAKIAGELRRMLHSGSEFVSLERELWVWDSVPPDGQVWEQLGSMLKAQVRVNGPLQGLNTTCAPAAALALSAFAGDESAVHSRVNLLRPRLAEPKAHRLTRTQIWAVAAAIPSLLFCLWLAGDWYTQQQAITHSQIQLRELMPQIKAAQQQVDKLTQARLWYDRRPAMLDCLRDVSQAMPEAADGSVWITSLVLRDDLSGTLSGKAQDETSAMELVNRLRGSGRFTDVRLLHLRQTDRTSKMVSFALTLQHQVGRNH